MTTAEQEQQRFSALALAIRDMLSTSGDPPKVSRAEELRLLYAQRQEWARHYNGLIWSITAILLPVALGGLALSFRDESGCLNALALGSTAAGSSLLLIFWGLICSGQRRLWEREHKVIHLVEAAWGLRPAPASLSEAGKHPVWFGAGYVGRVRTFMVFVGIAVWVVRVLLELKA